MTRKALLLLALALPCASLLVGQASDPGVALSGGPPPKAWTVLYNNVAISGVDYPEYVCYAPTAQQNISHIVTQIVDASNVATFTTAEANGLSPDNKIALTGATGGVSGLNGSLKIATVPTSTTFTVATSGITDATYTAGTMRIASTAPRTNRPIWAIKKFSYGGTPASTLQSVKWAVVPAGTVGATSVANVCDDRASLSYN